MLLLVGWCFVYEYMNSWREESSAARRETLTAEAQSTEAGSARGSEWVATLTDRWTVESPRLCCCLQCRSLVNRHFRPVTLYPSDLRAPADTKSRALRRVRERWRAPCWASRRTRVLRATRVPRPRAVPSSVLAGVPGAPSDVRPKILQPVWHTHTTNMFAVCV